MLNIVKHHCKVTSQLGNEILDSITDTYKSVLSKPFACYRRMVFSVSPNLQASLPASKEKALLITSTRLCDPARIQTWNLLIRSQILYSVELRGHRFVGCKYRGKLKMNSFEFIGKTSPPFSLKSTLAEALQRR